MRRGFINVRLLHACTNDVPATRDGLLQRFCSRANGYALASIYLKSLNCIEALYTLRNQSRILYAILSFFLIDITTIPLLFRGNAFIDQKLQAQPIFILKLELLGFTANPLFRDITIIRS